MSTKEALEKYFGTADLYKLLNIKKTAEEKNIKKAYYKLSLEVHPDRVSDEDKEEATEKFKLLSKVYQILTDEEKRKWYDESGIIGEDDDLIGSSLTDWLNLWRNIFQPLTVSDIDKYKEKYTGSELERNDIKKAYVAAKGCINQMMCSVPFLSVDDEPRLQEIVREMIAAEEVPEYKIFTNEPKPKRDRRHKKAARERKDAEKHKEEVEQRSAELEKMLLDNQARRANQFGSMMTSLISKYGNGEDEDDIIDLDEFDKKTPKKKYKKQTPIKKKASPTKKLHSVKKGKIQKKN